MTLAQAEEATGRKQLRLWPGVAVALLQAAVLVAFRAGASEVKIAAAVGGLVGALGFVVWWLFFSRAPWSERLGALALMVLALALTPALLHVSVAEGNMGLQFYVYGIPLLCIAFVVWAAVGRRLADLPRRAGMAATILIACGVWTLVRSDGLTGDGTAMFAWRWARTAEDRLLSQAGGEPAADRLVPAAPEAEAAWPGFRGRDRDGSVPGVRIETDWGRTPPAELWRRPVGPGTSSFAVRGNLLYTQEQRGEDEAVAAYELTTGELVWMHHYPARFYDPYVGAGPRATPTVVDGRVYALGATGILNALDAGDGSVAWSREVTADAGAKVPFWGFVSSPLAVDDLVVVEASGRLVAYERATGEPRWLGPDGRDSYSSPHLLTLDGVAQIVLVGDAGVRAYSPADGTPLWEHPWPGIGILQPLLTADGDLVLGMTNDGAMPLGLRRLAVARGPGGWAVEERWTSERLKPAFSPFVVHEGHVYGYDGSILAAIDLEAGERKWKGGRFGHGQLILLPDQDLLLVLSERGEVALVSATPDRFAELARLPAIEGRTWNLPVLVGDVLLVRNGQEMASFRLPLASG